MAFVMFLMRISFLIFPSVVKYCTCVNSECFNESEPDYSSCFKSCASGPHEPMSSETFKPVHFTGKYPHARKMDTEDEYHGMKIKDPYRWLEDPHSEETQLFQIAQNNISLPYLHNHTDREEIRTQFKRMVNFERYSAPQRQEDNYFYFHNTGLQNHSILYIQKNITAEPKVFLDPNKLSEDGTVALKLYAFSEDGKLFAYCLSKGGSDWNTLHIKNVSTGEDFKEVLTNVKFPAIAWTHDHKGFFYNRYSNLKGLADGTETTAHAGQKLYYHYLNTPQEVDIPVVEFPDNPSLSIHSDLSHDGRYLLVSTTNNTQGADLHYYDLSHLPDGKITGILPIKQLIPGLEHHYEVITNNGPELVISTNKNAPKGKVITMDIHNPEEKHWKTLIPEDKEKVLDGVACIAQNKLAVHYIHNVKSVLQLHDLYSGKELSKFPLEIGQVTIMSGRRKYNEIFYCFTSFLEPNIIYHCDIPENATASKLMNPSEFRVTEVPEFNPTLFQTKQVFYKSKDGTRIPMYIIQRLGLMKTKRNPVIIYGYGGYGVTLLPSFSISRAMFLRHFNGIYAIPNIRGGGELGEDWHNAGRKLNKQNVFDDFQAAAEYMIKKKYTTRDRLAIMGGSNGGLLTGACLNQRPDLYGAVLILVGALDMLRFNQFTIAYYSESEFGSPNNKTEFHNLLSYSPYHNIKVPANNTQYPATLLLTADHDDRVPPLHSYKFIAALQDKIGSLPYQKKPLLLRIEKDAGHGQGTPLMKSIDEMTDIYVFLMKTLGIRYYSYMP